MRTIASVELDNDDKAPLTNILVGAFRSTNHKGKEYDNAESMMFKLVQSIASEAFRLGIEEGRDIID